MQPGTVYIHDRHQLAVFHELSGYVAIAPRDLVLCARADEVRTGFTTSFFQRIDPLWRAGAFSPTGEARMEPCTEEIAWRDSIAATLDVLVGMSDLDRYFADLQAMWRGAAMETM